jgi:hypothetical protein
MILLSDDGTTPYWTYAGEVDAARSNGTPADDRPFVIFYTCSVVCFSQDNINRWARISPVDDATALTLGSPCEYYPDGGAGYVLHIGLDASLLGVWGQLPLPVYFHDTSHRHIVGMLRNIAECSGSKGTSGTLSNKTWLYRSSNTGNRGVCIKWDGLTDYP